QILGQAFNALNTKILTLPYSPSEYAINEIGAEAPLLTYLSQSEASLAPLDHQRGLCLPWQPENRPRPLLRAARACVGKAVEAATLIPHTLEGAHSWG
ncbi:hypothetical protein, partial [Achromobacter xylosoxidans]|uniref:hypothetical protein n=1 Tax=Alcaligenes xylosoxydans xylosoxydans TaxID=85698 RepID=UPI0038FCD660